MMIPIHFIRPWWFVLLVPLLMLAWQLCRPSLATDAWSKVCDAHLLPYLVDIKEKERRFFSWLPFFLSMMLMILSLAGPTWSRLPVPTYQQIQPRVLVLDMSDDMLATDLSPNRLSRAKFKLHDLFQRQGVGQFGLVVYTGEPFVVSPMTDDGQTIDALLSSLTEDVMPVQGQELRSALNEAARLISQAGFQQGQLLVMTATPPSASAIREALALAKKGIQSSIMPIVKDSPLDETAFKSFATAGQGQLIPLSDTSTDIDQWLKESRSHQHYRINTKKDIPVWRDEGRLFLIPALFFLLPLFRRGFAREDHA